MKPEKEKHIAIIGAGIVGVATAIWLQRAGHRVTLIDKQGVAAGTSYGNAGLLAACAVVPVTVPGLLKKAPLMLLDKNSPLFLRWSYLPKLMPFLFKYLKHANDQDARRIAGNLSDMLQDSVDQHLSLAEGTGAEHYIKTGDYIFGYPSREALKADELAWDIRRACGYQFHVMKQEAYQSYDPAMGERFAWAVRCPNHGHISDPGAYVKQLADHVQGQAGTFIQAEVQDIVKSKQGLAKLCLITSAGPVEADDVVICSGIWSKPLAKKLGLHVPLESERGYHIEFINPSVMPKAPVMVTAGKFVMTPMQGRLRCAGIVEFGGLNAPASKPPFELLKRQALALIPELKYERIEQWMGHRPSTPDSLPLIGAIDAVIEGQKITNIWAGFGHQHIGLTGGAKTGRWLAQMITGQKPNTDLKAFAPHRF